MEKLADDEPPLLHPGKVPIQLDEYRKLLSAESPVERHDMELIWTFPDQFNYKHSATLVRSTTPEGDGLCARLTEHGIHRPS